MTREELNAAVNARLEEVNSALTILTDETAAEVVVLFPYWEPDTDYVAPVRVRDSEDGYLYKLIPATHHSQADWPPRLVPAIWARVDEPGEEWPEWRQPTGAQDAYAMNDKVSHSEHHWISAYDSNVWEPGVYGWTFVE